MTNKIPPYLQRALVFSLLVGENLVVWRYMHIQGKPPNLKDLSVLEGSITMKSNNCKSRNLRINTMRE